MLSKLCLRGYPPWNKHSTWKWWWPTGISFSRGLFSGAMLVLGRENVFHHFPFCSIPGWTYQASISAYCHVCCKCILYFFYLREISSFVLFTKIPYQSVGKKTSKLLFLCLYFARQNQNEKMSLDWVEISTCYSLILNASHHQQAVYLYIYIYTYSFLQSWPWF